MHQKNIQSWKCQVSFTSEVDFCIWILEKDGLQIPPFCGHAEGNAHLRDVGLEATEWHKWLEIIVQKHSQRLQTESATVFPKYDPSTSWQGNEDIRAALGQLWGEYGSLMASRKPKSLARAWGPTGQQQLWQELQPYQNLLSTLIIYPVAYPLPVIMLIPPISAIIDIKSLQDDKTFCLSIVQAANSLVKM